MAKGPSMQIKLERRQVFNLALRGALEVLQMPQMELRDWLLEEIEKNPLIEIHSSNYAPRIEKEIPANISFYDHMIAQINENFLDPYEKKVALRFFENLDERGFLNCTLDTIAMEFPRYVDRVFARLQTLEPPGVFARNLQETLLIQLKMKGEESSLAFDLVQNCFEDLLHGRYTLIKKKLGVIDVSSAINDLAKLSMRPSSAYKIEPASAIHIDMRIEKIEGGWTLELVEDDLPKFHICNRYDDLELQSLEEQLSLREYRTQANWIFRSLNRRRELLRDIGKILICKQAPFLEAKGPLLPLSMRNLSEQLGVHESTLSRALSGKYAETPRGILSLKSLITVTPQTQSAQQLLEDFITNEDKQNPLTDETLATMLKEKGFKVARRTVAKYRLKLKIGSANQRKNSSAKSANLIPNQ